MARAAVLGRLTWRAGTVAAVREESPSARTIVLDVPGWPGHLPGQHVDLRLTAPDGYSTQRSYSIASAADGDRLELTVEGLADGEVSPYLAQVVAPGDQLELRGPIGGWFVWRPGTPDPVLLIAGGSGVVPLMAMIRARAVHAGTAHDGVAPFRLLYSVRGPGAVFYGPELHDLAATDPGLEITYAYTREAPEGHDRPPGRVDAALVDAVSWPPERRPLCFVCGPTGFVEAAADLLVRAGHDPARIRTERFGPTGGSR
ncbi:ferredoxin reductase [Sphaerisporangium sp. TRM90804]|uniref:ferredoxin reductase n=1 Tax=Sphaerisporangium sp. TRM90804 TaxID=3031113 RepID=UPI00244A413D|nr:ferredoxin reductase [Sphaerisporangium sp. TRM90804]MDH2427291.1 ferredoxin reductase [Sphaerisporangium sp. TRM90804]